MNAIVAKAMEAIARLPDTEQEAIAREVLARIEANQKRTKADIRSWLDDVQSHFADIEIPRADSLRCRTPTCRAE